MNPRRRDRLHRSALALALAASLAPPAVTAADDAAPADATLLEEVLVVGSRIRRSETETQQPVFVIEREQIDRSGLYSVGDLVQDLTTHGASFNTTINNGGNGEERADLRNLGDNRTLVLLDGRRLNTALDGGVDLSAIPLAIVERIEVLKDGASAIYGSDAVAGVVAIHTRDAGAGARASLYVGENEHGDGRVQRHDAMLGVANERAGALLSASYSEQDPIFAGDRAISAVPVFGAAATDTEAGASASGPNGRFGFGPRGSCAFNPAGTYPAGGCRDNGRFPAAPATTFDPATGTYRLFERSTDGFNFAPENYLQTPYERAALFAKAHYDISDTTRATVDALYNDRSSASLLAPSPVMLSVIALGPSRFAVPASQVYNPFGQPVNAIALRPGGQLRDFVRDTDTWRVAVGLDGTLDAFGRAWSWQLGALHADQKIALDRDGNIDLPNLLLALGPSFRDGAGVATCGTPSAPIAGCVPFDAFHGTAGITDEMLDYIYFKSNDTQRAELEDFQANITGDVMDLPAGPLGIAFGLELRRDRARFRPDEKLRQADVSAGLIGTNEPVAGSSTVREAYVELAVPLLAEARFAHALDLSLALRWSDYDLFGSTTNGKAGFRWAPTPSVTVRGNWSQAFRAPSVTEAFGPQLLGSGFPADGDPCVLGAVSPGPPENCIADGVPNGVYEPNNELFRVISGGNPALRPETAIDRTLGVVWSPPAVADLDVALDWFRIEIADAISRVGPGDIFDACFFQNVAEACARTTRDPATGQLLEVDARRLNSGTLEVEAYDLTLHYGLDTGIGEFDMTWDSTYYARFETEVPRGARRLSLPGNYNAAIEPGWRWRSNIDVAWQHGAFGAAAGMRHYPGLDEGCPFFLPLQRALCTDPAGTSATFGNGENRIASATYVDLQASWESPWDGTLRVGIRNAFDRGPPIVRNSFGNSFDPAYPVPGRFWYVGWEQRF